MQLKVLLSLTGFVLLAGVGCQNSPLVTILMPWLSPIDPVGRSVGSSFLVAFRRQHFIPQWTLLTVDCTDQLQTLELLSAILKSNSSAVIGITCTSICRKVALVTAVFDIPYFAAGGCMEQSMNAGEQYPTFIHLSRTGDIIARAVLAVVERFRWRAVSILFWAIDDLSETERDIEMALNKENIATFSYQILSSSDDQQRRDVYQALYAFQSHSYVVVVLTLDAFKILMVYRARLMLPTHSQTRYVLMLFNFRIPSMTDLRSVLPVNWRNVMDSLHGSLILTVKYSADSDVWYNYAAESVLAFNEPRFNGLRRVSHASQIHEFAGFVYDAVSMYVHTYDANRTKPDGSQIRQSVLGREFPGVGKSFTINGSMVVRSMTFGLSTIQRYELLAIGSYESDLDELSIFTDTNFTWPDKSSKVPFALPTMNESTDDEFNPYVIYGTVAAMLLVIWSLLLCGCLVYRHARAQVVESSITSYVIKFDKIKFTQSITKGFWGRLSVWHSSHETSASLSSRLSSSRPPGESRHSGVQSVSNGNHQGSVSLAGPTSHFGLVNRPGVVSGSSLMPQPADKQDKIDKLLTVNDQRQIFTRLGIVKGHMVAVRVLNCRTIRSDDNKLLRDLAQMKSIKQENLNEFIGVCLESPNVCILMRYAQKGSLRDLLQNEDISLSLDFRLSFAMDIANGMEYLHRSVIASHGHLSSNNCVIDNRWKCMVTDYGLNYIRTLPIETYDDEPDVSPCPRIDLWVAPELLRREDRPITGSPAGDVYSFGIILQEITTRDEPYGATDNCIDILNYVKEGQDPPFRPTVSLGMFPDSWIDLMGRCWREQPASRPTFHVIQKSLLTINKNKAVNVVDKMLHFMEEHAGNMEELVRQRQSELAEEKKKVESILFNMLPKSVVIQYVNGEEVPPEFFQSATIYFSDIDKFVAYSAVSTAIQIANNQMSASVEQMVELLNAVYILFDEITDRFDVYKVETINDQYMVASGLPIRNTTHVSVICRMSLQLLSAITEVTIPHLPGDKLALRVGIHTGTVVGGMLGHKVPRYCLFGDTINTASRMMTNGLAGKIQLSAASNSLADQSEFMTEMRGDIDIKGKGKMTTFWLLGMRPLPTSAPQTRASVKLPTILHS